MNQMVSVEFYQVLLSDKIIMIDQLKKLLQEVINDYNNGSRDSATKHLLSLQDKKMTYDAADFLETFIVKWKSKSTTKRKTRTHTTYSELSNNEIKNQEKRLKHQWEIDDQNYEITRDHNNYADTNYYDDNY